MSVSTVKEISETPSKNAVTSPTSKKALEADVERKMRLYGVFKAFTEGKYPSNAQIDKTLQYGLDNSPIDESKLSEDGRELIDDFRSIIETARQMVKKKNADELFQNFLYSTRKADSGKINAKNFVDAPVGKGEADQHGQLAAENLKTLGKLLFTNSEVRKLLKDIGLLGRDIAADAATKVADKARPSEEKLNQIGEPAPKAEWIGPDGEKRGPNQSVPDTGLAEKKDQALQAKDQALRKKDELKEEAKQQKDEAQYHAQDAKDRVQGAKRTAPGDSGDLPSRAEQDAARREGDRVAGEKREVAENKAQELKDRHVPQEQQDQAREKKEQAKDKAKELQGRTQNYLKDKIPEERRDRFIYRLKKVIVDQQQHEDYQDAVEFFLGLAENYTGAAKDVAGQTEDQASRSVAQDPHYKSAYGNLRTLLERFANNQSMDPIFKSVDQIYQDAREDEELRAWFRQLDKYVRRVLLEPGFVMKDEADRQGRELRENAKGFFNEKYRGHREDFVNSVQNFFQAYADDPLNVQFGQDWKRLLRDLALDSDNNLEFKPHLWQDVRSVILPELLNSIGYVPIPRIEYTDNAIDLVIENLILDAPNLLPNAIEMEIKQYFKLSAYEAIRNDNVRSIFVAFTQVQTDLKDVAFHFKRKQGFPRLSDSGIADVVISGKGISGKIHLSASSRKSDVFKVETVRIKIDSLRFKIRDAKHQFLYSIVRPLAGNLIKGAIAKAMEAAIRNGLDQLNQQLTDIKERLDDAKGRDDVTRSDVLKNVFAEKKRKGEEAKEKLDERNAQFRISAVPGQELVDWHSGKHSIIAKEEEREKLVHSQEHGWKSPAFDWVSELQGKKPTLDPGHKGGSLGQAGDRALQGESGKSSNAGAAGGAALGGAALGAAGASAAHHHGSQQTNTLDTRQVAPNVSQQPAVGHSATSGLSTTSGFGAGATSGSLGSSNTQQQQSGLHTGTQSGLHSGAVTAGQQPLSSQSAGLAGQQGLTGQQGLSSGLHSTGVDSKTSGVVGNAQSSTLGSQTGTTTGLGGSSNLTSAHSSSYSGLPDPVPDPTHFGTR